MQLLVFFLGVISWLFSKEIGSIFFFFTLVSLFRRKAPFYSLGMEKFIREKENLHGNGLRAATLLENEIEFHFKEQGLCQKSDERLFDCSEKFASQDRKSVFLKRKKEISLLYNRFIDQEGIHYLEGIMNRNRHLLHDNVNREIDEEIIEKVYLLVKKEYTEIMGVKYAG